MQNLDLLFDNREGRVGVVKVGGRLGHSDHEMLDFSILVETRRGVSGTAILDFWRADFNLFRTMVERVPWEVVLENMGTQEGREYFKEDILEVQKLTIPKENKSTGKKARLVEQRPLAGSQEQKESLWSLEEWASYL